MQIYEFLCNYLYYLVYGDVFFLYDDDFIYNRRQGLNIKEKKGVDFFMH